MDFRGEPRAPHPGREGTRPRSSWSRQPYGRRNRNDSRNLNPRWTPMGPRPLRGPYGQQRLPPSAFQTQRWTDHSNNNGPHSSRPYAFGEYDRFAQRVGPTRPNMYNRANMPPAQNADCANPSAPYSRSLPPTNLQNTLPTLMASNDTTASEPESPQHELPKVNLAPNIPPLSLNSSLPSFDLQARFVVQQCLLSDSRRRAVDMVLSDVRQVLRSALPDNVPIVYGSMATGLAWETSDIDCYIDSERVPDGKERVKLLMKNYKAFYRRATFKNVLRIPQARVPLIKAVHTKTGIEIDMSCTSEGALHNTKLIKYLVQTDERIRFLIALISLCFKLNGISGTNRFVSYTQVLLIIFYLQNLEVPMLPPLRDIVYWGEHELWPTNFTRDVESRLQTPNRSSLAELFSGFFKFYDAFDFAGNVVSPYLGKPVPVECFAVPDKLSDDFAPLKQYYNEDPSHRNMFLDKWFCVQDPMEHYINTTSYVHLKTLTHFKNANSRMVEITANHPETSWLDNMIKMIEDVPALETVNQHLKPQPNVEFSISYPKEESSSRDEWLARLKKHLLSVFKLLLFDIAEVSKEPEAKVRIAEGSVHNRALMTFELRTFFNVFTKRFKGLTERILDNPSILESAEKDMLRVSEQIKRPTSSFHCELAVKQPISPEEIPVLIRDINENASNTYQHLAAMLRDKLSGLLASARKYDECLEVVDGKPSDSPDVIVRKRRSPGSKFVISYKKREDEEDEEVWKTRFKADLISLFDFLLLEHEDVTSSLQNMDGVGEDESLLFAFHLHAPYNIFTKRFKSSYTRVLENPSEVPSVKSENAGLCEDVNPETIGTFRGELLLIRSDLLSPDQVFAKMYDINEDPRNNFSHYSSNLQLNFGGLLFSIRAYREMQSQSKSDADEQVVETK